MLSLASKKFLLLPLSLCLLLTSQVSASAQIVPDATLPNDTIVTPDGNTVEITGGTTAGGNLFHSFEEFSVPTGGTAFFNNAAIVNIISRVTGRSISDIDGLIRANGSANLFLINPNGIIFGPNASLDIGGSFIGSTANSILFADGSEFSAIDPQTSSLLTVSVPVGLQYGANARGITVQGVGNNLFLNSETDPSVNRTNRPPGLQVDTGQTLALVGGTITLEGGNLTASDGRIELGSVGEAGLVTLIPTDLGWTLNYDTITRFQDIRLSQAASLEVSGDGGGSIQVQGRQVILTQASAMLADTLGDGVGGTLTIRATDTVRVTGFSVSPSRQVFNSRISTDVALGARGNGGDLVIVADRLRITDGAQISSGTFGIGDAGLLRVTVQDLEISGGSPLGASGLLAPVEAAATGNGGDLVIEADRLRISDGAQVAASTFGAGDAGDLTVQANQIELVGGTAPEGFPSGLFANVQEGATGNGGDLMIETDRLHIIDGAQIGASTFGAGDAGSLTVQAQVVEAIGGARSDSSGLFVVSRSTGDGGDLRIETRRLQLIDGGQIATSTGGAGDAGNLFIRATESVELVGTTEFGSSGLFSNAIVGTGDGGDVTVITDQLTVLDGATLSVSNFSSRDPNAPPGQGTAGNLNVQANFIQLNNQGILTAEAATGDQGNITLQAETILLRQGSRITTDAQGEATGGNITINTNLLAALNDSDITANAEQSFGGRVIINAESIFGTDLREQPTAGSDITASSELGSEFSGVVELNAADVDLTTEGVELPSTPIDPNTQIAAVCRQTEGNEFVITGQGGLPEAPTQVLRNSTIWEDFRLGSREVEDRRIGGSEEELGSTSVSQAPIVEAQGWVTTANGQVVLVAEAPQPAPSVSWNRSSQCAAE